MTKVSDLKLRAVMNTTAEKLLRQAMPDMLEGVLNSFPVPSVNIGAISSYMPSVVLASPDAAIERQGHYYCLMGTLVAK